MASYSASLGSSFFLLFSVTHRPGKAPEAAGTPLPRYPATGRFRISSVYQ